MSSKQEGEKNRVSRRSFLKFMVALPAIATLNHVIPASPVEATPNLETDAPKQFKWVDPRPSESDKTIFEKEQIGADTWLKSVFATADKLSPSGPTDTINWLKGIVQQELVDGRVPQQLFKLFLVTSDNPNQQPQGYPLTYSTNFLKDNTVEHRLFFYSSASNTPRYDSTNPARDVDNLVWVNLIAESAKYSIQEVTAAIADGSDLNTLKLNFDTKSFRDQRDNLAMAKAKKHYQEEILPKLSNLGLTPSERLSGDQAEQPIT